MTRLIVISSRVAMHPTANRSSMAATVFEQVDQLVDDFHPKVIEDAADVA